jgi:hypothetical protein
MDEVGRHAVYQNTGGLKAVKPSLEFSRSPAGAGSIDKLFVKRNCGNKKSDSGDDVADIDLRDAL